MIMDRTTAAISGAAIVSPWWLPYLANASEVAGFLLPIFGVIWIIVQLVSFLMKKK